MQHQYMQQRQQAPQDQLNDFSLPLVEWIGMEATRKLQDPKVSVLRKLNVAYGIGKLLQSSKPTQELCSAENFIVCESTHHHHCNNTHMNNTGWEIVGIRMINPPVAVQLFSTVSGNVSAVSSTPASGSTSDANKNGNLMGRDVSAIIIANENDDSTLPDRKTDSEYVEMQLCCAFGDLLHFLFSEERDQRKRLGEGTETEDVDTKQPAKKQTRDMSFSQVSINFNSQDNDPIFHLSERTESKSQVSPPN